MKVSKAVWIAAAWILLAVLFNAGIYFVQGQQKALEFLTGYVIELSLSIDNLFVFFLIFTHFKVDAPQQGKILSWGVLGAQLMRAIFILGGVALLKHFNWVIYVFGILLIFSGFKLFFKKDKDVDLDENFLLRSFKKFIPQHLSLFWIVLIAVELADLVFAVDSIPAVLAVTKDPFIVYSSNIFAILGLRAFYLVLSPIFDRFQYLHYALGIILAFVGIKMLFDHLWHIPIGFALAFIVLVLSVFVSISFFVNKNNGVGPKEIV
jgi:tellurite resistance protein TerC